MTEKELRARTKLLSTMLTTYGYAIVLAAVLEPFTSKSTTSAANVLLALIGLACHGIALYISPRGEKDD